MATASQSPKQLRWLMRAFVDGTNLAPAERRKLYIKTGACALLLIWLVVLLTVTASPKRYESKWTLILPGVGAGATVSLDSIGQANSSSNSPYQSSAIDPRQNYKALSTSDNVLALAAKSLQIKTSELGKPKLKLPTQTGIMHFSIKSATAQGAQDKAWALYHSLQALLNSLREDESRQRENGIKMGIEGFASKVNASQKEILAFQSEIGLVSLDQFKELALTIERLRHNRVNLVSKLEGLKASQRSIQAQLSLSPQQAADILTLKNDQLYQQLLVVYTNATSTLAEISGRYGAKHPQVLTQKQQQNTIMKAMTKRSQSLLGYADNSLMLKLSADDIDMRAELMSRLLSTTTELHGLTEEINTLDSQINQWYDRLTHSHDDAAKLEDLHRQHQVATAVFTSALAKMDVGKSDIYSAYPMVQLLSAPSLAEKPSKMATILAIIGGLLSSFMLITGLGIAWIRKPILRKIVMKS
ncbi:GumC family protein [Shewanella waksmanii]|uniref:GumC family protein n=1 Tax=Shewanella waksmanii TaxID=213783 RepID=UPI0037360372